ncbi:hypothetical protein ES332_A02G117700v1 [Gossypium tomentosum]|uniref:Defensin-like protein n=1 Tax=Gossypium tomentosum TaxID=34277 RepID=A0A5D2RG55_GOSTO|nr:hypothetical protein ES332_A02G117700v1 [Gossypium tomentosum]
MAPTGLLYIKTKPHCTINTNKTMVSSKLLVVAVFLLFSYSFAKLHGAEKGPCKSHSNGECSAHAKKGHGKGCHFAGTCSSGGDCRQACAALGRNPDAVECVTSTGENRCCCLDI